MTELVRTLAEWSSAVLEGIGIVVILVMAAYAVCNALFRLIARSDVHKAYERSRQGLGRGILFGLEFLVAADIIRTVALELTFRSVGVLAIVVLIRTFLSFTLDVELTGRWPWQQKGDKHSSSAA